MEHFILIPTQPMEAHSGIRLEAHIGTKMEAHGAPTNITLT